MANFLFGMHDFNLICSLIAIFSRFVVRLIIYNTFIFIDRKIWSHKTFQNIKGRKNF